jgi:hypothetical protein
LEGRAFLRVPALFLLDRTGVVNVVQYLLR